MTTDDRSSANTTGRRVCVYLEESDHSAGRPLYLAILELLRRDGAAGATVIRGLAGFGAGGRLHSASIVDLAADLPLRVEWVDERETVERLLPAVRRLAPNALITVEPLAIVQFAGDRRDDPLSAPVSSIMHPNPVTISSDASAGDVLDQLMSVPTRSLPVVAADGRLLGILTDGDLLRHAGQSARLAGAAGWTEQLTDWRDSPETAAAIMTAPVQFARPRDSLREAAARMVDHNLKRLPVVDGDNRLLGIVSRIDILRVARPHDQPDETYKYSATSGHTVIELMDRTVPTVGPEAGVDDILRAIETTGRRRVVVVDDANRVLGIITDGDMLRQITPGLRPGLLARLRAALGGPATPPDTPLPAQTAAELMSAPAITIRPDATLSAALDLLLGRDIKRLPVVDADGRLLGLLGRAGALRGLLQDPT